MVFRSFNVIALRIICLGAVLLWRLVFAAPDAAECGSFYSRLGSAEIPAVATEPLLRDGHATFSGIGEEDNRAFIDLAHQANEGQATRARLFLDLENAVIKDLNDKVIRDKALVTALTNRHKSLFWQALRQEPEIYSATLGRYSDFKSLRFAFTRDDPSFRDRLAALHALVNAQFEKGLEALAREKGWTRSSASDGPVRLANWHCAGIGHSPDEAGLAARYARRNLGAATQAGVEEFTRVEPKLVAETGRIETLRARLSALLAGVPGALAPSRRDSPVLSAEAIETVRKAVSENTGLEDYLEALRQEFKRRFGKALTPDQAELLRDYVAGVDRFSPGIYSERRVVIDLARADFGVISADFKGQNARNIEQTARALAEGSVSAGSNPERRRSLGELLRVIREGEAAATRSLERGKKLFENAADTTFGAPERIFFSGDDGIFMPQRPLNDQDKKVFLTSLMAQAPPESFRITFVPSSYEESGRRIPAEKRSSLIVEAESIEKKLRKELIRSLNREDLNHTLIAVDFHPHEKESSEVVIHLVPRRGAGLPPGLADSVRAALERSGYRLRRVELP